MLNPIVQLQLEVDGIPVCVEAVVPKSLPVRLRTAPTPRSDASVRSINYAERSGLFSTGDEHNLSFRLCHA